MQTGRVFDPSPHAYQRKDREMFRKTFSKVMWLAKGTSMMLGLAVMLAVVLGIATAATAATGRPFFIGKSNAATTMSSLTANIAGPALNLVNKSTASAATALNLKVAPGHAPLKVNSTTQVPNLNASQVDGKSANDFYAAGSKVADSSHADSADNATNATNATNAGNANTLNGKSANGLTRTAFGGETTPLLLTGSYQPYGHVTINAPAAGYVLVTGAMTFTSPSACSGGCVAGAYIGNQTNGAFGPSFEETDVPAGGYISYSDTAVLPVQAGSNTISFYVAAIGSTVSATNPHMSAIYSPYDGSGNASSAANMSATSNNGAQQPKALTQLSK